MIEFLVPYYGDPGMAIETLESVRAQTSDQWRVVLLDDAYPTSEVRDWITDVGDERITYLRNETNLGANGNYRKAISVATEDHVCFLGADDRLLPDYADRVITLADDPAVVALHPGIRVIDGDGEEHLPRVDGLKRRLAPHAGVLGGERLVRSLMHGNWTYFPAILWRREAVRSAGFRDYHVVQDLALLVDLVLAGGLLRVDDQVTFEYRRHAESDSSRKARSGHRFDEERRYFDEIASELTHRGWDSSARAARLRWTSRAHAVSLAPGAVADRDWPAVRDLLRHGIGA